MATKFSQFNAVGPSATTEIVGLDGGVNAKFAVGDIDISNLTGLPLSIQNGGTGQTTPPLALDALTDAANQVAKDILYIDGTGATNVAAFINPSQLTGVPIRTVLYATWEPGNANVNYFNFTNGSSGGGLTNVPFNTASTNFSTDSVGGAITFSWNGQAGAAGNTTFTMPKTGAYKITLNINLFDQNEGMIIQTVAVNTSAGVTTGVIYDVGLFQTGSVGGGQNKRVLTGSNVVSATAGDIFEIQLLCSGGTNSPNVFPSTNGDMKCSLLVEYVN
jgi:hypothetical protein